MNRKFLSGSSIKIIAIVAMLIDHVGFIIVKDVYIMQAPYSFFSNQFFNVLIKMETLSSIIGNLAFPLFCFLLVEGFINTHNISKYLRTLMIFAIFTEPIYDWALTGNWIDLSRQNVLFTLSLGLMMLILLQKVNNSLIGKIFLIFTMSILSYFLRLDGWYYGILLISTFYLFKERPKIKMVLCILIMFFCSLEYSFEALVDPYFLMSVTSLLVISCYNGKRGKNKKYFFYFFYPVHLLLIKIFAQLLLFTVI